MNLKKKFAEPGIIISESIKYEKENVFDPGAAQAAIQSLSCLKSSVEQSRNPELVYYKTGTSYGFRDAWAVGMNGAYLVGVWIGNSDGKGIKGLTGREAAVPLMKKVFDALGNGKRFSFPYGFKDKTMLCSETGYEAGEYCEKKVVAMVPRCAIPAPICPYHKKILSDSAQQFRYHTQCAPHYAKEKIMLVMEPVQELYYKLKNPTFVSVPPLHPDCLTSEKETEFQILYPREGLQLNFPDGKNEIICKVTHRNKKARLKWYVDDSLVAQTTGIHQISVSLKSGKHKLSVMDSEGNAENVCFEIME
jgi:penicillin-binding protein 1C